MVDSFRSLSSILTLRSMERSRAASWRSIMLHVSPSGARQASRSIAALSSFAFSAYSNSSRTLAISSSSRRRSSWRSGSPGGSQSSPILRSELLLFLVRLLRVEVQRVTETVQQPENQRLSPPLHTLVKRFQYGVLAGPEGALLHLLPYEFKKRKSLSQRHASICRLRQVDIKHLVLGGVEGDAGHLLLAAVLPVVDRLQGAPLQAVLRPLQPFAAPVEPGEVLDLLLPERVAGTEGAHEFLR